MNENPADSTEEALFERALALAPGEVREAFLLRACGDDASLRHRVDRLLVAHQKAGAFMKTQDGENTATMAETPLTEGPGARIGRYKLLQQIGEGGMGVVYMAEQEEPVRRRVALKIVKLGMDTRSVVARFEAERQALALMDHPNIARVLDGGSTDTGRPYFVMELVQGVPITEFCDHNTLNAEARLRLFVQVCQAIQSAHQKGVIHRDIKPSNVLVTLHHGDPMPKVIDFGIAKATNQRLTEKTLFTQHATLIGTPAYMSPEQAEMSSLDVDTRSDIYSLGVLLYELLAGSTPFTEKRLRSLGYGEMQRVIREEEPEKPSTRLSTLDAEQKGSVARSRNVELASLSRLLRGDLDWIVMKCLEKNRTRRYETANGLASDIQRHLENLPIVARPPSAVYGFRKAIRRHRAAYLACSAVALSLLVGLAVSIEQTTRAKAAQREQTRLRVLAEASERRARTEATRSERVSQFLRDMLKGVRPSVALGRDTTLIREILDKTAESLGADLRDEPAVEARLRTTLSETYRQLGDLARAESMIRKALALRPRLNEDEESVVDPLLHVLGSIHYDRKEYAQAEAVYLEALAIRRRLTGDSTEEVAATLTNIGNALWGRGDTAGAEARYREAIEISRRLKGEDGFAGRNLAAVLSTKGENAEAEVQLRQYLENMRRKQENPYDLVDALDRLAVHLSDQGKPEEAEPFNREALALLRKNTGQHDPALVLPLQNLAYTLRLKGDFVGELDAYREALAICRQHPGNEDRVASALFMVSTALQRRHEIKESESSMRECLEIRKRLYGPESNEVAEALHNLSAIVGTAGDAVESERYARECLAIREKAFGPDHPSSVEALNNLGWALVKQDRLPEAEQTFRRTLELLDHRSSSKPEHRRLPLGNLTFVLSRQGKLAELKPLLDQALLADPESGLAALYLEARGGLLAQMGRWPAAAADFARAVELEPANHEHYHCLAPLFIARGDIEGYRQHCGRQAGRFHDTKDALVAERMAKDCLILPDSGVDLRVIGTWVDLAVTVGRHRDELPWFELAKGLSEYRRGHFQEAVDWAQKALSRSGDEYRDTQAKAVLAMSQHRLGQTSSAQASLTQALELEGKLPRLESGDAGPGWLDWIITRTLVREARNRIEGGPTLDLPEIFRPVGQPVKG